MVKLIYALSRKESIEFSTLKFSSTAVRTPEGKIEIIIKDNGNRKHLKNAFNKTFFKNLFLNFSFYILIPVMKTCFILPNISNLPLFFYFLPAFFYLIYEIVDILILLKKYGNFRKNHAAEHQVFKAFKALKKIPSIDEANRFSRISRYCGISVYSALITGQIIGFIFFFFFNITIPEWFIIFSSLMLKNVFPFYLIGALAQFFTTSPADDENINLAICALTALEEKENGVNEEAKNNSIAAESGERTCGREN